MCRTLGIPDLLKAAESLELSTNSPRALVIAGVLSLLAPAPQDGDIAALVPALSAGAGAPALLGEGAAGAAGGGAAAAPPGGDGGRIFSRSRQNIVVALDDHALAPAGVSLGVVGSSGVPHASVSSAQVPDFLRTSYLTGEATAVLGFVNVSAGAGGAGGGAGGEGNGKVEARAGAEAAGGDADAAALWEALFAAGGGGGGGEVGGGPGCGGAGQAAPPPQSGAGAEEDEWADA